MSKWISGELGYIKNSKRCVGSFVGVNAELGRLVFFKDGEYKSFHKWQVSKTVWIEEKPFGEQIDDNKKIFLPSRNSNAR